MFRYAFKVFRSVFDTQKIHLKKKKSCLVKIIKSVLKGTKSLKIVKFTFDRSLKIKFLQKKIYFLT
jgi:hypothetical protein